MVCRLTLHNTLALKLTMDVRSYISGYVDGEGCFCISFTPSKRHRFGWEVRPSFSVSQNGDRAELLYEIQELWESGHIRPDRSDKTLKYEVRDIGDLCSVVIPHFVAFPLRSSKQCDVLLFGMVCEVIRERRHLLPEGLAEIVDIAMRMNPSGKRRYSGSDILASL